MYGKDGSMAAGPEKPQVNASKHHIQVVAGLVLEDGKVLLARRAYGALAGKWEFPGGKVEPGEKLERALVRELAEELGVKVAVGEMLCSTRFDYPHAAIELYAFLCTLEAGIPTLGSDHLELNWVSPGDLAGLDLAPADLEVARMLTNSHHEAKLLR